MSYANPDATLKEFSPGQPVAYVHFDGKRETGTVSSIGSRYVFVRFDDQVRKLGWSGATSMACDPRDLIDATPSIAPIVKGQP